MSARYTVTKETFGDDVEVVTLTDSEGGIACSVAPAQGAELTSLRARFEATSAPGDAKQSDESQWVELIHRGNDFSDVENAGDWTGRGPFLFPAVGRSFTPSQLATAAETGERPSDCAYVPPGETEPRSMPLHGFAQHSVWECESAEASDASGATLVLHLDASKVSDEVRGMYPYNWDLKVCVCVQDGIVAVETTVGHRSGADANLLMPFTVGTHPSFRFPLLRDVAGSKGTWAAGIIAGTNDRDMKLSPFSCLTGEVAEPTTPGRLPLPQFCDNVLSKASGTGLKAYTDLLSPEDGFGVRVAQTLAPGDSNTVLDPNQGDFLYTVLWGDESQGFICVEPWCGGPNALNGHTGGGAVMLAPGNSAKWVHSYEILRGVSGL